MPTEARKSSVLGPDGTPVKVAALTGDRAGPTLTGVRSVWHDGVSAGLDPRKLASILKAANEGDNREFLTLAEEMEERDAHYASVLAQRKLAVSGISPIVAARADAGDKAAEITDAVETLLAAPEFAELVDELLDGLAKGYAVCEIDWDFTGPIWTPRAYHPRDPRHFQFDKLTGRRFLIRDDDNEDGVEIAPSTMIIHRPRLKSGLPVRGGLARIITWCFMLKTYTLQDWAAFLEIFGMPLRVGKYDKGSSPEERRVLLRAVRELATDASAIIPMGMEIEFIQASGGSGNSVFGSMTDYLDKQISKAVVGQTMTTDAGSSRAQSETHDEVRGDLLRSDARQLGTTITRDLVAPFVAFNWGPDAPRPSVYFPVEDAEDLKELRETARELVPMGLRIAVSDMQKRSGFRTPDPDEAVLVAPKASDTVDPPAPTGSETATRRRPCPDCGGTHLATREDDALVDEALTDWEADIGPVLAQLRAAAAGAASYEGFLAALDGIDPDTAAMARRLAIQQMKARGDGDLDDG